MIFSKSYIVESEKYMGRVRMLIKAAPFIYQGAKWLNRQRKLRKSQQNY